MPNLALVKAIAVALILAATFAFGWSTGSEHVQAQWDRERAELNAQAAKAIEEANSRVRKAEQASSNRIAQSEKLYLTKLKEKSHEENFAIDRARTGGLFINAKCPSRLDAMPDATQLAGSGHGETRVELPKKDGEFLIRLAAEADRVTEQLTACQAILESERQQ